MDALLLAFIGCLLAEMGGKSQLLLLALAKRFDRDGAVIAGISVGAIASAAISAIAGAWIAPMLGSDARLMFMAVACWFMGAGMLWPVKAPDTLDGWPTGAFFTSYLGLFILCFGEGAQFLVLGIATWTADPVLAGIGGAIGMIAALVPVVVMRDAFFALPVQAIRWTGAGLAILAGFIMVLAALRLV